MPESFCPECEGKIRLSASPSKGDNVTCPACGAYLQVVSTSPIELDWAFDDDDEEEFEEEEYDYES
ncbi:MAG: hypothetical protein JXA97_09945 [Anaerolineales bacterium]|nr:hypothetical protein [Anaerolineales bacterium]